MGDQTVQQTPQLVRLRAASTDSALRPPVVFPDSKECTSSSGSTETSTFRRLHQQPPKGTSRPLRAPRAATRRNGPPPPPSENRWWRPPLYLSCSLRRGAQLTLDAFTIQLTRRPAEAKRRMVLDTLCRLGPCHEHEASRIRTRPGIASSPTESSARAFTLTSPPAKHPAG